MDFDARGAQTLTLGTIQIEKRYLAAMSGQGREHLLWWLELLTIDLVYSPDCPHHRGGGSH